MQFDVTIIETYWQLILSGIPIIIFVSLFSAVFGSIIGLSSVFLRKMNKVFHFIISAYIDVFRGTPVYVQLYFLYFGLPQIFPALNNINGVFITIVIFSLNSGAYLSEIIRAGIEDIDKGQIEAAKALGVNAKDIAKDIIVPQAFRKVLPGVVNEFITLTKETAIISLVGQHDMMYWYTTIKSQTFSSLEPLLVIFIAYYLMNKVLSLIGKMIERKLRYD